MKHRSSPLFYCLTALVLFFALLKKPLLPQGNALIIPGEEVGVLRLGNPIGFVKEDLGNIEPSSSRKVVDGKSSEMWLFYRDLGLTLVFDYETKRLQKIVVLTPRLLVKGTGIRVGVKQSEVLKYFKTPSKASKKNELDFPHLGITFYIKEDDKTVHAIEVNPKKT